MGQERMAKMAILSGLLVLACACFAIFVVVSIVAAVVVIVTITKDFVKESKEDGK